MISSREESSRRNWSQRLVEASITEVLEELGIAEQEWDALVVGDGSSWPSGCGWGSVLIQRHSGHRKPFCGSMSSGNNNLAELMPYVQALLWYRDFCRDLREQSSTPRLVHIVTDSQLVARQGNQQCSRACNQPLWHLVQSVESDGFVIFWHWLQRQRLGLNRLADRLARSSRLSLSHVSLPEGSTLYACNPDPAGIRKLSRNT